MRPIFLLFACAFLSVASPGYSQATLRSGDIFDLRLTGMPADAAADFSGQYTVGDDGNVAIPYVGPVKAAGLSSTQLAGAIDGKLIANKIFTHPTAIIALQPQSRTVTVGGAVRSPQAMPWTPDLSLNSAIMRAGGTSDFANTKKIKISRGATHSVFNLKNADKDPAQNPKLQPGDVVEVPE